MKSSLSLYLHIPFCRHRCAYCDFNTYTGLHDLQEPYAEALAQEVEQVAQNAPDAPAPVHTVFFGGGTPSLMAPAHLECVLSGVSDSFSLDEAAEITMEANPGTVDGPYLHAMRALGVNRLSLGMQSADAGELALLEREHDLETVVKAVRRSREAGFANINIDLIYGLPDQSVESWERSLRCALSLNPEHLSLYCLTIEPGTRMARWLQRGAINVPDADRAADQYEVACRLLAEEGWVHYEISNWARPGYLCHHNLTYWRNGEYLGLGAGSHGHAGGYRYEVVRQPRVYLRRMHQSSARHYPLSAAVAEAHFVTQQEAISDTMITRLRLLQEGLVLDEFEREFGRSVRDVYGETIDQLINWGLLEEKEGRLTLSEAGWFLSNQVFYRFL